MKIGDLWGKFKKKVKSNKMYQNLFGFESGIDLTNDAQVLHRKNQVIKIGVIRFVTSRIGG